ncbi:MULTISPECIES: hypothetical protein [Empedobacter]|jgi:broad-specificity NMP kinase|uniref:Uncharacterized protein n=1 Tax=Empedobacter falsenii TaxID=343874 RepID=A0A376GJ87_9FLAO|nr:MULTISPECIES: hypothetical protein [Empedobacter]MDM1547062.1 hypothetical protein [Empedobacter falsenii]QLL57920.1 hypothetical protein FH779_07435 [Empedobacter falsenii]STD58596.1 Uncharacterised protein [Empedobacter falsenii]HAR73245.1 hypothetical protein [Flavobacteriaceae bacterium]
MKPEHLNSDSIQSLLNELYNRAFEKGYEKGKKEFSENCETDPREGVIISEGGDIEKTAEIQMSNQEKLEVVEYIKNKLFDILND